MCIITREIERERGSTLTLGWTACWLAVRAQERKGPAWSALAAIAWICWRLRGCHPLLLLLDLQRWADGGEMHQGEGRKGLLVMRLLLLPCLLLLLWGDSQQGCWICRCCRCCWVLLRAQGEEIRLQGCCRGLVGEELGLLGSAADGERGKEVRQQHGRSREGAAAVGWDGGLRKRLG